MEISRKTNPDFSAWAEERNSSISQLLLIMICYRLKTKTRHYGVGRLQKDLLVKLLFRGDEDSVYCFHMVQASKTGKMSGENKMSYYIDTEHSLGLSALFLIPFPGESLTGKYLPMIEHEDKKRLLKDWLHLCEGSIRNAVFFKGSGLGAAH